MPSSLVRLFRAAPAVILLAGSAWAQDDMQSGAPAVHVGLIEIRDTPADRPGPLDWLFGHADHPTLRTLVAAIDKAAVRDDVDTLVIRLKDAQLKATQVEELGAAVKRFRDHGKKVHVYAENFDTTDVMLGSYADEVIAQSGGSFSFPGLHMEEMFLADTLQWAGLKASFVQIGDYKGASEQMARNAPSPQWDANISALLDSLYAGIRRPVLDGRHLTDAQLDEAMQETWMADPEEAAKAHLVDSVIDLPMLTAHLEEFHHGSVAWDSSLVPESGAEKPDTSNPFAMLAMLSKKPQTTPTGPAIGVVHIDGPIIDGESGKASLFGGNSVGSRTIRNALEQIRNEDLVKGVVLRIDSPGGSATASEVIWQGVRRVAEKKPVWVSVGSMAASGGYYIAVAGDRIFVNPSSIGGSSGVVGGTISMGDLYAKLKVNVVSRSRGPRASMFASSSAWSPEDLDLVRAKMTKTYEQFTRRVTAGRKGIDLAQTAEGRLFTGNHAIDLHMADEIGGLDDAIREMAASLSLDDYEVMDYPAPKALAEVVQDALGGFMSAPGSVGAFSMPESSLPLMLRRVVGERAWSQFAPAADAFMQMRDEPVLLTSPSVLIFR